MKIVESEKQKIADQLSRLEDEKEFFSPLEWVYEHKSTPTVTHYSSSEIMPIMYDKISESDFVRSIWDITGAMKYYSMSYEEISLLSRSARWTTHRILVDTQEAHQYKKDHPEEELRLVADSALSLSDEFMMDGVVYHGRYDHNHTGIAITDDTYYRVQCYLFDTLWNSL